MNRIFFMCFLLLQVLTAATMSQADELNGLSLGYGSLSPVKSSNKTPSPSSLTVQYRFSLLKDIKPYIGTGMAYLLPQENRPDEGLSKIKTGMAGQAGVKINLDGNSSLNIDYKYLHIAPDATRSDTQNPQSFGFGLEIKFK